MMGVFDERVYVIDWETAGRLAQPFEQYHEENVVVFPYVVELRQLEKTSGTKYTIHTERFTATCKIDPTLFLSAFQGFYELYKPDVRKIIIWALKGTLSHTVV